MSEPIHKPVVVIGTGGHASVLVDILRSKKRTILAVLSPDRIELREAFHQIPHFTNDMDVRRFSVDEVVLVNGIGPSAREGIELKRKINESFLKWGFQFETLISSDACVSPYAKISPGVQVLSGAIIHPGAKIGGHSVINTGAIVEHDCIIGEYNHVAPCATLCGNVSTGADVFVGAASVVLENLSLGCSSTVGAGAVLTRSLKQQQTCYSAHSVIR